MTSADARKAGDLEPFATGLYRTQDGNVVVSYQPWIDSAAPWTISQRPWGTVPRIHVASLADARQYVKNAAAQ